MQQVAGRAAHVVQQAARLTGPNPDREQHDVGRSKACHGERSDQGTIGVALRGGERCRIERHQAIAETLDRIYQRCRAVGRPAPDQAQAPGGHVDAALEQVGFAGEDPLDQPDTGAALQAVDRQGEFVGSVGMAGDEAGVVARLDQFGTRRAKGGIKDALSVVAAETEGLDDLVSRGTAGAAEAVTGGGRQVAVEARGVRGWDRFAPSPQPPPARGGGGMEQGQCTMTRRVADMSRPPRDADSVSSHWPGAGKAASAS